jgi:hypothetical protein
VYLCGRFDPFTFHFHIFFCVSNCVNLVNNKTTKYKSIKMS